jgi:hypothetical protein
MPDRYEMKRRNDKVQNAAQGYRLPDQYELKRKMNEVEKDISIYPGSPTLSLSQPTPNFRLKLSREFLRSCNHGDSGGLNDPEVQGH